MTQAEILKHLRVSRGYTAKQVADKCEIPYGVYLGYEGGSRNLGVPPLMRIADFYGVSTDVILGRDIECIAAESKLTETISEINELAERIYNLSLQK